jgi:iron complex outermembrane recepter protein
MNPIPQVSPPPGGFRRFVSCLLGLSLALASAWAQTGTGSLSGKVTDSARGAPLVGAIVSVDGASFETATSRDGAFYFGSLPAGEHTIRVSYLGYEAKGFPVTVVAGQSVALEAKLGEDIVQLEKFTVEGQREGQARALNQQRASGNLRRRRRPLSRPERRRDDAAHYRRLARARPG